MQAEILDPDSAETASVDRGFGPKTIAFLAAIRVYPHIAKAAGAAGIRRELHWRRLKTDEKYRAAFEEAWAAGIQSLADEAIRRAMEGVKRPVLYHGAPVYVPVDPNKPKGKKVMLWETDFSDTLMLQALRSLHPQYKEKVEQQHTGAGGGPLTLEVVFVDPKPHESGES